MEGGQTNTNLRQPQQAETRRRVILFAIPFQGHMNPMFQLANILHTNGFKITIIHTEYNAPNSSNHPHFTFKSIPDGFDKIIHHKINSTTNPDAGAAFSYLNECCAGPFRDCLTALLREYSGEERVACLITDAGFYFTQAVADSLNLPRIVLRTSSLACVLVYGALPLFIQKGYFNLTKQDPKYEEFILEFPMKVKDVVKITMYPESMANYANNIAKEMKASSGIIWNTFKELEELELETIHEQFRVPSFTIGPFHKYIPSSPSSLLEKNQTIIPWLDIQAPKSVIYVSFGSVAHITEFEFQEVAHGLANVGLPFIWVVRPWMVHGSEWLEALPEKFLEKVGDRGRIVKWSPQQEVLAHPATGCFWTHNGWNSTVESICEGVPMICSPCFADQAINARYVCDVWKIGVVLEDGFERVGIEKAINKVMVDKEGHKMREQIIHLKEKLNLSLDEGGSSRRSLRSLVDYISSF